MRRASLLLGGAACAAAFAAHAAPSEAGCVATVKWRNYTYMPYGSADAVKAGAAIAERGVVPGCSDTVVNGVPGPRSADLPAQLTRIEGVEPSIAVLSGKTVYVNNSSFTALPSHPLHSMYRQSNLPGPTGAPCQIKGVAVTNGGMLTVNGAGIFVTPETKVELKRHGTGFVAPGTVVRVGGSACEKRGDTLVITARRIARA